VITAIRPGGTFVWVCAASEGCGVSGRRGYLRLASLSHAWGYLATKEKMVALSNFHAHSLLFPVKFAARLDPMPFQGVQVRDGRQIWFPDLPKYSERTGGTIDYVLLWGMADAARRGDDTAALMDWLSKDYELSFVSSTRRAWLYQRKHVQLAISP